MNGRQLWKKCKRWGNNSGKLPFYFLFGLLVIVTFPLWFPVRVGRIISARLRKTDWTDPKQWV